MIYRSLLTVHHLKRTHKDQVLKVSERSQMEDDEERLKHLYQNIPSMRQVMHTQFVDSLSEGCEGIKELRETMSDRGSLCSFRLPLSWFHLHLMAMSLESEEMPNRTLQVQSYGDLCEMCMKSELVKSEEEGRNVSIRSSKSSRGHSQSSYYKDYSDSDEGRGKGTKSKRYHSDPKQSRLQNEPRTGLDLAINSTTDLLPYLDQLKTQLYLLGSVLGIQDETAAIKKTSEDSTTKCLRILQHWLKVTANPSWSLLCSKLKGCDSFNNVREQIEKDHFQ